MKTILSKLRDMNIQSKLISAYIIIISIPLLILSTYIISLYQKDTIKNFTTTLDTHLSQILYDIDKILTETQMLSDYIANNEQVTDYLRHYQNNKVYYDYQAVRYLGAYLNSISQINPNISAIHIYTVNPDIPRYRRIVLPVRYLENEDIYSTIGGLRNGQKYWSRLHYERVFSDLNGPNENFAPRQVFSLYQNIYAENLTDILAYLELNITSDEIADIIAGHSFGADDIAFIAAEDNGNVIYKTPNAPGLALKADMFGSPSPGALGGVNTARGKYVYRFTGVPSLHIRLILLYPYEGVTSSARARVFSLAILLISGFATISLMIYFISNLIFKRLKALTQKMGERPGRQF